MKNPIVVVGSANLDIVVPVPHHPRRGETVLGDDHVQVAGGKGANQAVAAARLGGDVSFVGCVGADPAGNVLRESLVEAGVDTTSLFTASNSPSGIALITVGPDGDNAIVVSPGANALLSPDHLGGLEALRSAAIVQLQLEIPVETTLAAAELATGLVILDPAPAPAQGIPKHLLAAVDLIVPNETELALLAGREVDPEDIDDIAGAARSLGVDRVVVTLGRHGAVVVANGAVTPIGSPRIEAVDTTGAGDAFRSALAVGLANGLDLVHSAQTAARVGAATALRFGAQTSLPTLAEVDELLP